MATINCTNCAGAVEVDATALQTRAVDCPFCGTHLRLTDRGTVIREPHHAVSIDEPPPHVVVERDVNGRRIAIGRTQYRFNISKNRAILVAVVALAVQLVFFFIPFVPFIAVFVVGVSLFANHRPRVYIKDGQLVGEANWVGSNVWALEDIKQPYIVTRTVGEVGSYHFLYILDKSGERKIAFGPYMELESAEYAEALLEREMGLFDLPVVGEAAAVSRAKAGEPTLAVHTCANCATELVETATARKRGTITCPNCRTVRLLYSLDGERPMLGLPEPNDPSLQYRMSYSADNNVFAVATQDKEVLAAVQNGRLRGAPAGTDVHMQAVLIKRKVDGDEGDVASIEALATVGRTLNEGWRVSTYSDDIIGEEIQREEGVAIVGRTYRIFAKAPDGSEKTLIEPIESAAEAALIFLTLRKYMNAA